MLPRLLCEELCRWASCGAARSPVRRPSTPASLAMIGCLRCTCPCPSACGTLLCLPRDPTSPLPPPALFPPTRTPPHRLMAQPEPGGGPAGLLGGVGHDRRGRHPVRPHLLVLGCPPACDVMREAAPWGLYEPSTKQQRASTLCLQDYHPTFSTPLWCPLALGADPRGRGAASSAPAASWPTRTCSA